MSNVKVTFKLKILEFIDRFIDDTTANDIGSTVVQEAKRMISEGKSPARTEKRFQKYSDSYKRAIQKNKLGYPKSVRPVNLYLSGDMLDAYKHKLSKHNTIAIGMVDAPKKLSDRASYHQKGEGKMPKRQIIPEKNQEWAVSIMRKIRDIYGKRLADLIKKTNK